MEQKTCSGEDGCPKKVFARGLCHRHYAIQRKAEAPLCSAEEDCGEPGVTRGMCSKHYTRLLRNGDPLAVQYIRGDDEARFESHVDRAGGAGACHLWTGGQCHGGYAQIRLGGTLKMVHVAAWEAEHGPKPPSLDIDHDCHNRAVKDGTCWPGECPHRLCCNPAHLVAKTRQQHSQDTDMGIWEHPRGSDHGMAKLNEDQVQEIRKLLAAKIVSQNRIAEWYGVGPNVISRIKLGKIWGWLPLES